jgi:putative tryptophan/tyrosine transport system substrate-binding protein
MNKRIVVSFLATLLFVSVHFAEAQQAKKVSRIGLLVPFSASSDSPRRDAFLQGLRDLGYVEGKNITIEYRYTEGQLDRLPDLAAELVRWERHWINVFCPGVRWEKAGATQRRVS